MGLPGDRLNTVELSESPACARDSERAVAASHGAGEQHPSQGERDSDHADDRHPHKQALHALTTKPKGVRSKDHRGVPQTQRDAALEPYFRTALPFLKCGVDS